MIKGLPFPNVAPSGQASYKLLPLPLRQLVDSTFGDPQINIKPFTRWELTWTSDCLSDGDGALLETHYLNNVGKYFPFFDWISWQPIQSNAVDVIKFGPVVAGQLSYTIPVMNVLSPVLGYPTPGGSGAWLPPAGGAGGAGTTLFLQGDFTPWVGAGDDGADLVTFASNVLPPAGTVMLLLHAASGRRRHWMTYLNDSCPVRFDQGEVWTLDAPISLRSLLYV